MLGAQLQRGMSRQRSGHSVSTYDRQMATPLMTIDRENEWIAGLTLDANLRLCTGGSSWPISARLDAWPLVGWRTQEVDFVRRPAAKRVVGATLVVPVDKEANLTLELRLVLGHRDQPQDLLERSMESFDDGDAAMLVDRTEPRQDVFGLAPGLFEVLALELGALINDQVFGLYSLREHDPIQRCRHLLRRGPALEHGESHGSP